MMSGIRDLMILYHWLDNDKKAPLEASLSNKKKVPKERQVILRELKKENLQLNGIHKMKKM